MAAALIVLEAAPGRLNISAQQDDYLIVPGQRVGKYELGKTLGSYRFGQPRGRWDGKTPDGKVYYDGYSVLVEPVGLSLQVFTCRSDGLVYGILAIRPTNRAAESTEATKFGTAEGIRIGTEESEVIRLLGSPQSKSQWTERHGNLEVQVAALNYPGLRVLVSKGDGKVFAIGPVSSGGWPACQQAVLGPAPRSSANPASLAVTPLALKFIASQAEIPLAKDIRVVKPESTVPGPVALASGMWDGTACSPRQIFVVEEIRSNPPTVRLFYAWARTIRREQPGWTRLKGTFDESAIFVNEEFDGIRKRRTLRVWGTDSLLATNEVAGQRYSTKCTLSRVKE